ncbi:Dehydrogenase/reductase SDR family protein 7-like [Camponotus floridanus]|uniref:Dehydrogenase/reductase SDR family protein 7-like n=1 Tax=Camponotus floridanus TaxID=104421 RepID=E2A2P1_CAMFO|nr:dehydrogenase/reductase SDR family protein 7-like [Camponotus floridanus]EFN72306.1 Dehydrogenase/reductase SDR family protein 7-like [Camponotus floridanus]
MNIKRQEETLMGWSIMWWLFKLFGLPITIPWLIYHFLDIMQQKRKRAALSSKVIMITGASSGLGEALAHTFYRWGCRLILVSRRKEELERVKNDLMNTYQTIPTHPPIVLPLDLTDINNMKDEVSKAIMVHGRIDILINNAGITYRGEVINTSVDVDLKVMMSNYFSQVALSKIVLPFMIEQKSGHIVGISSVQGRIAIPFRSAYAASKHALQAWYDTTRAELFDKNIKITVISPGYIKTSLSLNALTENGQVYGLMDKTTENGYQPEFVAECILKSVLKQEKEVTIAPFSPKVAIVLRTLFPSLFFWIMQKRAKNK